MFLHSVHVMQYTRLMEKNVNRSLMLMDRLDPEILLAFGIKGQVLHRQSVHVKVPSRLWDFSALLIRKLSMLMLLLKDTSGGSEKIWSVLGSFCRIWSFRGRCVFLIVRLYD